MNIAAHQKKEKNEEINMGKRKAGEERRQTTDCRGAVCCLSAVIQGAAQQKKWFVQGKCLGYLGPLGRPTAILTQPKWGRWLHHHVEVAVDWCRDILLCTNFWSMPYRVAGSFYVKYLKNLFLDIKVNKISRTFLPIM